MKKILHSQLGLLSIFWLLLCSSPFAYAGIKSNPLSKGSSFLSRGLEVRYIVLQTTEEKEKKEIEVEGKKYALYLTKEDAVREITNAVPKRDYVIVYVVSDTEKQKEIIELAD